MLLFIDTSITTVTPPNQSQGFDLGDATLTYIYIGKMHKIFGNNKTY